MRGHLSCHASRPIDPSSIIVEGATWLAVRTSPGQERRVARDLTDLGFRGYCPVGQRYYDWTNGRRAKAKQIRIFARFAPYIFVGCPPGRTLQKRSVDNIDLILRNSDGLRTIPQQAIQSIKDMELSGAWDETVFRPELFPMQPGDRVRIMEGAFAGFPAILQQYHENGRCSVDVKMFGRVSPIELDACAIEAN
jgi:transcription antitermination factor NusG